MGGSKMRGTGGRDSEHKKENENSEGQVAGLREGEGLMGIRISECDDNRAGRGTGAGGHSNSEPECDDNRAGTRRVSREGLELKEQQSRACGGDHKEGAGQPARPEWEHL